MELNLSFSSISDAELCWLLENDLNNGLLHNDTLKDYIDKNKLLLSDACFTPQTTHENISDSLFVCNVAYCLHARLCVCLNHTDGLEMVGSVMTELGS